MDETRRVLDIATLAALAVCKDRLCELVHLCQPRGRLAHRPRAEVRSISRRASSLLNALEWLEMSDCDLVSIAEKPVAAEDGRVVPPPADDIPSDHDLVVLPIDDQFVPGREE